MKKLIALALVAVLVCGLCACGSSGSAPAPSASASPSASSSPSASAAPSAPEPSESAAPSPSPSESAAPVTVQPDESPGESSKDPGEAAMEAIGEVNVETSGGTVTITVPAEIVGDTTQDELDGQVADGDFISAVLNDDGSVTMELEKERHSELLKEIKESVDEAIEETILTDDFPSFVKVEANEDYSVFTVTTNTEELSMMEEFAVMALYTYGKAYGAFAGNEVDNIHVDFVNESTGEVFRQADSKDMGQ